MRDLCSLARYTQTHVEYIRPPGRNSFRLVQHTSTKRRRGQKSVEALHGVVQLTVLMSAVGFVVSIVITCSRNSEQMYKTAQSSIPANVEACPAQLAPHTQTSEACPVPWPPRAPQF